ncbi:conserved hypothetical protein [Arthrobacter sp. Hiyo8]|uniref:Uncharacterized protein YbjT (DUF2867 family) n=2 Tax=Arthrobacter TaxID=1663 RepID=A0AAW8D812_9MICC|nr:MULTISPECIES: NAD-dependent epimerase/dehydratase family protein [Arthrobacter]MDP9904387.1 uncharacterized protein YbjT (DUF2867 family) [Arthrobacter bambusae]MDQ0127617.1 uncharacterized protein YbjT (DUF2867 family) [Arthrobacter bambusae]MDQ0178960.1 uncharacterized protein YbjT (DUF2867 family) [Arthrobacter bambusae]BAS12378.1 conserved hypothetical protein [Arthrobacter sp. Hiyo8]
MNSTMLVTGGTGTLGRLVVSRLRDRGHAARVAGRHAPPPEQDIEFVKCDLDTGEGVEAALSGVRTVVHCAGAQKGDGDKAGRLVAVASREVADQLVELALGEPAGLVPDFAGPACYPMGGLIRSYLAAAGQRRLLVPLHMPGSAAKAIREGANLSEDRSVGRRTWEEFLTEHVSRAVRR